MRLLTALLLVCLVASCKSVPTADELGRVRVVNRHGDPIQYAVLTPDLENTPPAPHAYDDDEIKQRSSDANGVFHIDMDDCIWESDQNYHFRIHRAGYDDFTMAVSKDLFPPMLKVELREKGSDEPTSH
ncbi:MAG TPA: hypothetical protein VFE25_01595 [Opitutaceae bacterium]|jgi:hypothetical protein|nr:hypothetical protein [Opitutaceae bacterium]